MNSSIPVTKADSSDSRGALAAGARAPAAAAAAVAGDDAAGAPSATRLASIPSGYEHPLRIYEELITPAEVR